MKFWLKRRGTISVFLALILLPVVVFGGLVTDAVRVYQSKGLVSEAGELAMNAGLSYYDGQLKDEYGLLAMKIKPEDMDLEKYFVNTIRASGLPGAGDVGSFLDLKIDGEFNVQGVDGSQIYQTEAEKQQILEYMKYRAPVCIGEELVKKLKQIKDSKKQVDAVQKQTKFAKSMDGLQDACEKAKKKIDKYLENAEKQNEEITKENIEGAIASAESSLQKAVVYLLLLHICETYSEKPEGEDCIASMQNFNLVMGDSQEPSQGNMENIISDYLQGIFYQNNIPKTGLGLTVTAAKAGKSESEADAIDNDYNTYQSLSGRIDAYKENLKTAADACIDTAQSLLKDIWKPKVKKAKDQAKDCAKALKKVSDKLKDAQDRYNDWTGSIEKLPADDMKTNMQTEAADYQDLLDEGQLQKLKEKFEKNQDTLEQIETELDQVLFCGMALASGLNKNKIKNEVDSWNYTLNCSITDLTGMQADIKDGGMRFMSSGKFEKPDEIAGPLEPVANDPFYAQLERICTEDPNKDAEAEKSGKDTTNNLLGKLASALTGDGIGDLEEIDWSEKTLPSDVLEQGTSGEPQNLSEETGGAESKGERDKAFDSADQSLEKMGGFLDKLARIFEDCIENIYITEYGIQMFSYFTVNKEVDSDGNVTELDTVESLSGDNLKNNKLYRSEVEYILWGNKNVQKNVENTRLLLYGIRLVFNMIYAFTDKDINDISGPMATAMSCGIGFLVPVFKALIKVGVGLAETACDVTDLMAGRDVPIIKDKDTRQIDLKNNGQQTNSGKSNKFTMNYGEYLTIFLLVNTFGDLEKKTLARIADCIQLNTEIDLINAYTMLSVGATVKSRTTFMKKAAELPGSGISAVPDDWFSISYKSALGY